MATVELTKENFHEIVTSSDTVVVDFWADWCGPCKTFAPTFEKVSEQNPEIVFGKIDTEAQQELASAFNIMSIPTLMILREGVVLYSQPGAIPESALSDLVEQTKALDMEEVRKQLTENVSEDVPSN